MVPFAFEMTSPSTEMDEADNQSMPPPEIVEPVTLVAVAPVNEPVPYKQVQKEFTPDARTHEERIKEGIMQEGVAHKEQVTPADLPLSEKEMLTLEVQGKKSNYGLLNQWFLRKRCIFLL